MEEEEVDVVVKVLEETEVLVVVDIVKVVTVNVDVPVSVIEVCDDEELVVDVVQLEVVVVIVD